MPAKASILCNRALQSTKKTHTHTCEAGSRQFTKRALVLPQRRRARTFPPRATMIAVISIR